MINWNKSAELNKCNVGWLKTRFSRFPWSKKKVVRTCDICGNDDDIRFCEVTSSCKLCSDHTQVKKDRYKGGFDTVWHHVAYDFNDLEALRVSITRKFHGSIHHPSGIGIQERGYSLID